MPKLCAQETGSQKHIGAPQDWSQRQIVFSRDALARHPELMDREPRIRQQMMQHWQAPNLGAFDRDGHLPERQQKPGIARDWNVNLGSRMHRDIFPAKFSFDPSAPPDCVNDYVVFGLNVAGVNLGQANLVAFNNLYVNSAGTGFCPGTAPNVLFAYNITTGTSGGKIVTSPVISLDGKKIAFVESAPAPNKSAIFHVLTWAAGAGSIGRASPPNVTLSNMTSTIFNATGSSTTASPWVDYDADTAYVGDDVGNIYQIKPVFAGGLPVVSGHPWPVQLSGTAALTPPVLDASRGLLMVGSNNGNLYQIDTTTGALGTLIVGQTGTTSFGIIAPPIVDPTNGVTYVVSGNIGHTGAALVQTDTATLTKTLANIGIGGQNAGLVKVHLYQPAFSNGYYSAPSLGVVSVCGTGAADASPWQYEFGFTGAIMNTTPVTGYPRQLSTVTTDVCTGMTEFFNPNAGPSDTITATAVASGVLTVTANNSDLTVGEQVLIEGTKEPSLNGQTVTVTSLIGSGPSTGFTANVTAADYPTTPDSGTVAAINVITATSVTSNVLTVTAINSNLTVGENVYIRGTGEAFLNGETVQVASLIGAGPVHTGFTAAFTISDYSNLTDTGTAGAGVDFFFLGLGTDCTLVGGAGAPTNGCVVALANNNNGTITTTVTGSVTGGPSGIVVDNYSSASEASSIYLMSTTANVAFKFTQEGLQ
ncbi:MAG: hypothetical protein WA718_06025 [Terriglobales bacterium]